MQKCTEPGLCSYVQTLVQHIHFDYIKLLTYRAPNSRTDNIIIRRKVLLVLRNTNNTRIDGQTKHEGRTLSG